MKDYKSEAYIDKSAWGQGVWINEDDRATWRDDLADYHCGIDRSEETGALSGWFGVEPGDPAYEKQADSFPIVWPSARIKTYHGPDNVWRFEQAFDQGQPAKNWMPEQYRDWNFVTQAVTDGARSLYAVSHPEIPDTRPDGPPRNPVDSGGDTPTTPPPSDGPAPQNPGSGDTNPTPDNPVGTPESGDQGETQPAPPTSPAPVPGNPPDAQPPAGEGGPEGNPDGEQPGAPDEGQTGGRGNEGTPDRTDGGTAGGVS